ncbi:MAG: hypothetical protein Q9223_001851 [Gallowayella weberi]
MAAFLQSVRQGFRGQAGRANGGNPQPAQQRSQNTSPVTGNPPNSALSPAGAPVSFPTNPAPNIEDASRKSDSTHAPEEPKWFFHESQAKLGVKGNFMPLAAKPHYLDLGDWLAHQTVEQYRLINYFIVAINETNQKTNTVICNPKDCPTMSAGRQYTYTWLNHEKKPIPVPACQYIALVQRWIVGKIHDPAAFPTDSPFATTSAPSFESSYPATVNTDQEGKRPIPAGPTTLNRTLSDLAGRDWIGKATGFPDTFLNDVRTAWRQMFRIYAHLYHAHFIHPFWHIHSPNSSDLNSAFCYFVSVGKLFGLIGERDLEPMQALIDIWVSNGSIPMDCANGTCDVDRRSSS